MYKLIVLQHMRRIEAQSFLPVETRIGPVSSGSDMSGLLELSRIRTCEVRSTSGADAVIVCVAMSLILRLPVAFASKKVW